MNLSNTISRKSPAGEILIVDDTPANLRLLTAMLSDQGYSVRPARNGELALMNARAAPPDLILLDIKMPGLDGYEVCKQLKNDPDTHHIPIIFLSALDQTEDKVKAFTLGGVDYITKPFQIEEVLARVRTHLTIQRLKDELRDSQEQLSGIFDSAMDAIISLDDERRITLLNRAAEEMFRCQSHAVSNRHVSELFTPESAEKIMGFLDQLDDKKSERKALWVTDGLQAHPINAIDAMDAKRSQAFYRVLRSQVPLQKPQGVQPETVFKFCCSKGIWRAWRRAKTPFASIHKNSKPPS